MPITSSGEISLIADIEAEFDQTGDTDISLFQARDDAGLSDGQIQMTDFYGLSDAVSPSVTTSSNSSIGTSSIQANGNVTSDGGGTVSSRGFYFGTSSTYSNNTKYTVSGTTGSFNRNFTGLSAGTTYYATAFVVNQVGESVGVTRSSTTTMLNIGTSANISVNVHSEGAFHGSVTVMNYKHASFSSGSIPAAVTASGYTFGSGVTFVQRWWSGSWSSTSGSSATLNSGSLSGEGVYVTMKQQTYLSPRTIGHGCTFSASGYTSTNRTTHTVNIYS